MDKNTHSINKVLVTAFITVGIVAVIAVIFKYPGKIEINFGSNGINLQINAE